MAYVVSHRVLGNRRVEDPRPAAVRRGHDRAWLLPRPPTCRAPLRADSHGGRFRAPRRRRGDRLRIALGGVTGYEERRAHVVSPQQTQNPRYSGQWPVCLMGHHRQPRRIGGIGAEHHGLGVEIEAEDRGRGRVSGPRYRIRGARCVAGDRGARLGARGRRGLCRLDHRSDTDTAGTGTRMANKATPLQSVGFADEIDRHWSLTGGTAGPPRIARRRHDRVRQRSGHPGRRIPIRRAWVCVEDRPPSGSRNRRRQRARGPQRRGAAVPFPVHAGHRIRVAARAADRVPAT